MAPTSAVFGLMMHAMLMWLFYVVLASATREVEHLSRWCGPCEAAQQDTYVAISLANERKGVVCDLSCLDAEEESLSCNALGLGQACRFCGECEACVACPEGAPATKAVAAAAAAAVSYSNSNSTNTSITNIDDRADCSECESVSTEDAANLLLNGKGIVCDPECLTDATLNCNVFGLGRLCRLCGSCNGCEPCPERYSRRYLSGDGAFSETTDGPTSAPTGAPTGSPTSTSLGQDDCPVNWPSTEKCRASEEGLSCGYDCVCCEATAVDQNCLPVDLSSKDSTCGFTTVYSCDRGMWYASQAKRPPCPTMTPVDVDPSTPAVILEPSGSPIGRYSEGGTGGDGVGCPVQEPGGVDCSQGQDGIECSYGCFCCDEETEVDEHCVPLDPSTQDNCVFTSHLWCMEGVWIRAAAELYCPSV